MIFLQKSDRAVLLAMALSLIGCTNPPEATDELDSRPAQKREQPANGQNSIYWIKDPRLCDELGGKIDAGDGICRF